MTCQVVVCNKTTCFDACIIMLQVNSYKIIKTQTETSENQLRNKESGKEGIINYTFNHSLW